MIGQMREKSQERKKEEILTAEKLDTKLFLDSLKEASTEAKTVLFSSSEPKQTLTGF